MITYLKEYYGITMAQLWYW